jgi:hypothetical protein
VEPDVSDDDLRSMVRGCEADVVCVGHCHAPLERRAGAVQVVNVASVSNPPRHDRRAAYALLEADAGGHRLTLHRVAYDTQAVIDAIRTRHFFPNPDWLIAKFADPTPTAEDVAPPAQAH